MGRFDNIRNSVAELIEGSRDEEPEPQGYQGEERSSGLIRGGVLEHEPDRDDLNYYRELYENVGPIKSAIDNYSSEIIEPGWYITADDPETVEELTEFFRNVGIVNHETDANASALIEEIVREREILGTVFMEKVTDSDGRNQALYPLQNDTITIYTKPGKAMLPAPDGDMAEPFEAGMERDEPPINSGGDLGAYVQFDNIKPKWSMHDEVVYTRNDVIKWVRDAEIGDPRGQSRIASSARRAEGLLEKLSDNDDAVKFKAWPQIIFQMGDEENPWSEEEVMGFIEKYEEGNMKPGMMQAVAGDVSVEEFAGETADISDTLEFDISMIMSGLPGPVYATGGFSQNIAPAVAQSQQRQFIKEVKKTRREVEQLLTPFLRETAEQYDLDAADTVELNLGRPDGSVAPEDVEGSIIKYTSDSPQNDSEPVVPISSDDVVRDPDDVERQQEQESSNQTTSGESDGSTGPQTAENSQPFPDNTVGERVDEYAVDELADPRLVNTTDVESELETLLFDSLVSVRDDLLSVFEDTGGEPLRNGDELERVVNTIVDDAVTRQEIDARSRDPFLSTIEETLSTLRQDNHSPTMNVELSARHRQRSRFLSNNMADSFENVADDMVQTAEVHIRQAVQHGESPQIVADRLREHYSDDSLRNRVQTMARLEVMSAVNSLKLAEYDRHSDIVGVELINPCNEHTTPICQELACDDTATAFFDRDQTTGKQFEDQVDDELLFEGFDPLPTVPPFHFGCRTEIVPVMEE